MLRLVPRLRDLAILFSLLALHSSAQTTRSTTLPTPTADFELHEWAIFVAEPLAPRANAVAAIKSTLPPFVVSRRPDAADRGAALRMTDDTKPRGITMSAVPYDTPDRDWEEHTAPEYGYI